MPKIKLKIIKESNKLLGKQTSTTSLSTFFPIDRPLKTLTNKLLKLSVLPILLGLSTPSIAELIIEESNPSIPTADSSDQCGYYHRQVINYPMITANAAVTDNPDMKEEIKEIQKIVEQYIMNADITTFPSNEDLHNYMAQGGDEKVREVLRLNNGLTQSYASDVLIYLFNSYYLGEYVPKDDYKAVRYLSKYIELYQQIVPEQVEALVIGTIYKMGYYGEVIDNENNPTWSNDIMEAPFKILIEAGLIDAETMQLTDDFDIADPKCIEYSLPKIIVLANEGSRLAIHFLSDKADSLIRYAPDLFNETDKRYWQQKAEKLPVEGIDWRP